MMTADQVITHLKLEPHPEGGWFRQTWAANTPHRPAGTCIYFLLKEGIQSAWHQVDAGEIWHYYTGAPLVLRRSKTLEGPAYDTVLGPNLAVGEFPQLVVEPYHWQAARSTGDYTLVGCTVSPGFEFSGFNLTDTGFDIPSA